MLSISELFDSHNLGTLGHLLEAKEPWDILHNLDIFMQSIRSEQLGQIHPSAVIEGNVYLAEGAEIGPHVYIEGPAWIGPRAKVKHGAYLRGGVVLAEDAEVGAKTEVKRALFLPGAKAAHLNYVGDSVLGNKVNLGAGVKLANFKTFGTGITIGGRPTGLRKLGAMIGDQASLGCNAVTTPGTIIGPRTLVYNCAVLRGIIPADTIVKLRQELEFSPRHE